MKNSTVVVEIALTGPRQSGKSALLALIRKAIVDAGYPVSGVQVLGDESRIEKIFVTTQTTRTEWTTKLPQ